MAVKLDDGVDKWELQHLQDIERCEKNIAQIYDEATSLVAKAIAVMPNYNSSAPFSIAKYPAVKKKINGIIDSLADKIQVSIVDGISSQWTLANNKNNELCNTVFGDAKSHLSAKAQRKYYTNNEDALKAFIDRKEDGLNLSQRVWQSTEFYQEQIELGIDLALRDGVSSAKMSTTLKQYLKEPDRLFRRVADQHGILHLSKAAKSYNPGAGTYRSSSKNAMRLAVTETNMAYRKADLMRWQDFDFVVGYEVKRSNHVYDCSVCEDLKGKYPKDFVFTSWHPWCRCYVVPILKTEEEMAIDNERIMNGEEPLSSSKNTVTSPPKGFNDWVKDKSDVIERSKKEGSLPYFLRDNKGYVDGVLGRESMVSARNARTTSKAHTATQIKAAEEAARKQMIADAAAKRHATRDTDAIQSQWNERKRKREIQAIAEQRHANRDDVAIQKKWSISRIIPSKTPIKTIDDLQGVMDRYFKLYPEDTNGKKLLLENYKERASKGGYSMMHAFSQKGVVGFNSSVASKFGFPKGDTPFDRIIRAFEKIRKHKSLDFDEEYAIESFYHEMLHVQAKEWRSLKPHNRGDYKRTSMETLNQFVSRHQYSDFIGKLGGKALLQQEVLRGGYGYYNWVSRFRKTVSTLGLNEIDTYKHFNKCLINNAYDTLDKDIFDFFKSKANNKLDSYTQDEFLGALESGGVKWNEIISSIQ